VASLQTTGVTGADEVRAVSVVVPAYNEERGIDPTLDRLSDVLGQSGLEYEVIVVDDGSSDRTGAIVRDRDDVRLVEHTVNRGCGASLKTGIRHTRYPLVAILDADGTYEPEALPALVRLAADHDMVVGARTGENVYQPWTRRMAKRPLFRFAEWIARQPIPDLNSGLRVFRRSDAERYLGLLPDGFSFTTTITLAMITNNHSVHYEPVNYAPRIGKSKIRPIRDTLRFVQLIARVGVFFAPMRVFLPVAGAFFLGFLISLTQDLIAWNLTDSTLLLLGASAQLGMFALLADMVAKRGG